MGGSETRADLEEQAERFPGQRFLRVVQFADTKSRMTVSFLLGQHGTTVEKTCHNPRRKHDEHSAVSRFTWLLSF